jgi:hypothetical protein
MKSQAVPRVFCRSADSALPLAVLVIIACSTTGCNSEASAIQRFIPSQESSQAAISKAFDAWKTGTPAGPVPDTSPLIHLTDNHRRPSEKLISYRILGEVPGDTPRCYAVELKFDPPRDERARYVVVGIDPLWVFRLEDYQLLAHWEHKMEPPPASTKSKP